jgi:hypothetical protein
MAQDDAADRDRAPAVERGDVAFAVHCQARLSGRSRDPLRYL